MKILPFTLLAFVAFVSSAFSQAQVGVGSVKLGKPAVESPTSPEYQVTGGSPKRSKTGKWLEMEVEFEAKTDIPELTFEYIAQIEGRLLPGSVTYVNILKGKGDSGNNAVMYISPKAIEKLTGGKSLTPAGIENVWIEVKYQGQTLDKTSVKPSPVPNSKREEGFLLNKNETPFSPLYYDRYPTIKAGR